MTEARMEKIALDMLICKTLKEVAEKNNISELTLRRLRKTAEFDAILSQKRAEAFERVFDAACSAAPESVAQLILIMNDKAAPASARVSAARSILDVAHGYYEQTEVLDRIAVLESMYERMIDE